MYIFSDDLCTISLKCKISIPYISVYFINKETFVYENSMTYEGIRKRHEKSSLMHWMVWMVVWILILIGMSLYVRVVVRVNVRVKVRFNFSYIQI